MANAAGTLLSSTEAARPAVSRRWASVLAGCAETPSALLCCAAQDLLALARATTRFWNLGVAGVKGWQLLLREIMGLWLLQQIMLRLKQTR
jgi:hypothetical protein